jgi:hypothetical protein
MSEMLGERKMPINNVRIRICDAFGQLSHPSPGTVEPDRVDRTAGAVSRDEPLFQISKLATPNVRFALSPGKALCLRKGTENNWIRIAAYGVEGEPSEFTQFSYSSPPFRDGDARATAFRSLAAIPLHRCPSSVPQKASDKSWVAARFVPRTAITVVPSTANVTHELGSAEPVEMPSVLARSARRAGGFM